MKTEQERIEKGSLFEGIVSLRAVLEGGRRPITHVYYDEEKLKKAPKEYGFLKAKAMERGFELHLRKREVLSDMAVGGSHGGLLFRCGERELPLLQKDCLLERGFYVLLDGIEDPYNFGYALRSLYAAGADGVILPRRNWMQAAGIVCRSSAGASERMELYQTDGAEDLARRMKACGYRIVCADMDRAKPMYDSDLKRPLLLVIGGERRGISKPLLALSDAVAALEYGREFPAALSAASAAAILGFEVYRQNREGKSG